MDKLSVTSLQAVCNYGCSTEALMFLVAYVDLLLYCGFNIQRIIWKVDRQSYRLFQLSYKNSDIWRLFVTKLNLLQLFLFSLQTQSKILAKYFTLSGG